LLDQRAQLIEGATEEFDLLLASGLCALQGNPIGGHQCLNILASHLYYCSDVDTRQLILLEQFDLTMSRNMLVGVVSFIMISPAVGLAR
jgi:hypothetical protein